MDTNEQKVEQYLTEGGFRLERFSKRELRNSKTPDFRVFKEGEFAFFCEVKSVDRNTWWGGLRNDPIYNRLTADIHDAVKQFNTVNPKLEYPNVIAIVNRDFTTGYLDLIAVTTGNFIAKGGEILPIFRKYSEGRIREEKKRIHLYIWLDDFKANKLHFNLGASCHLQRLCNYFQIEPASIRNYGA